MGCVVAFFACSVKIRNANQQLIDAIKNADLAQIEKAISRGADINYADTNGDSCLMVACRAFVVQDKVKFQIVDTLISHGADINHTNTKGRSAIIYAIVCNEYQVVEALVQRGASINNSDNDGRTPLDYALVDNSKGKNIADFLIDHGAKTAAELEAERKLTEVDATPSGGAPP